MERPIKPLPSRRQFMFHVLRYGSFCILFICIALGVGIWGYMHYGGFGFVDALLNASMILGGMGPVDTLKNDSAKIFASFYALFSGIAFLTTFAVFIAPFALRALHIFHLKQQDVD